MGTPTREFRQLANLAGPFVAVQVGTMLLSMVDTLMLGRLSVKALAAGALGHIWIWGTVPIAMGVVMGIGPIVSQAFGADQPLARVRALQRGLIISIITSVPVILLWSQTETVLIFFGQPPDLAADAHTYVWVQASTIPFFLAYIALREYLQSSSIVRPNLWVIILANILNVILNWVLIFGHLGFPALGIVGAGWATALTRLFLAIALLAFTLHSRLLHDVWIPWSRACFHLQQLGHIFRIGWPVGVQIGLECWAFQIASLMAGQLGVTQLAAHIIVLNLASMSFMLPYGISQAAATRVGQILGKGKSELAQQSAWIALFMGIGVMSFSSLCFLLLRETLPALFTSDLLVIGTAAGILPIAAAFQLFDGCQVVGSGILRGMGRTRPAALFNLLGYYVLALPASWWLSSQLQLGLVGIWWGLCGGLAIVAICLLYWIRTWGPKTVRASLVLHEPTVPTIDPPSSLQN